MIIRFFGFLLMGTAALFISCNGEANENIPEKKESLHYTFNSGNGPLLRWVLDIYRSIPSVDPNFPAQKIELFQKQWDSLFSSPEVKAFKEASPPLSPEAQIQFLKKIVYQDRQIAFDSNSLDPKNVFPPLVWENRKGNCMGVSLILLAAAGELNIPLYGVHLPGHFFVRFQQEDKKINLEPNRGGFSYSDEEYKRKYTLHPQSPYTLKNLSAAELAGVFLYNLGSIELSGKKYSRARDFFMASLRHFPGLSEAHGNLGLCWNYLKRPDSAEFYLTSALNLNPVSLNVYQNLSGFYLLQKDIPKAKQTALKGLEIFPNSPGLNYNFGLILKEENHKN